MTRKDYIAVAAVFKAKRPKHNHPAGTDGNGLDVWMAELNLWRTVVDATADVFKADNPAFDHKVFRRACGMEGQ
jgi:hypothetical protein